MSRIKCDYNRLSDFHKKLHQLIEEIGLSIPKLAKKIGASESTIRDGWFTRDNYPGSDKIIKLLKLSKRSANWLFDKEDTSNCNVGCQEDIIKLCRKVKKVIESKTKYSIALNQNIDAFHDAVEENLKKTHVGKYPESGPSGKNTKKKAM
jgi:hypothetical protein